MYRYEGNNITQSYFKAILAEIPQPSPERLRKRIRSLSDMLTPARRRGRGPGSGAARSTPGSSAASKDLTPILDAAGDEVPDWILQVRYINFTSVYVMWVVWGTAVAFDIKELQSEPEIANSKPTTLIHRPMPPIILSPTL